MYILRESAKHVKAYYQVFCKGLLERFIHGSLNVLRGIGINNDTKNNMNTKII